MANSQTHFDKYEKMGAYHWRECDRRSKDFNPPLIARYEAIIHRTPKGRVLDVGAGDGYLAGRLAALCAQVIALEYEPAGVELARRMLADLENVTVVRGSSYDLPFDACTFDGTLMADVIEHLDQPERAVSEMARVAKPDAVSLITTPHWRADRVWDVRHVKEYTAAELQDLLSRSFKDVELRFCWPKVWSDFYRTAVGWRLLRLAGKVGLNPFSVESSSATGYCQIVAICRAPR